MRKTWQTLFNLGQIYPGLNLASWCEWAEWRGYKWRLSQSVLVACEKDCSSPICQYFTLCYFDRCGWCGHFVKLLLVVLQSFKQSATGSLTCFSSKSYSSESKETWGQPCSPTSLEATYTISVWREGWASADHPSTVLSPCNLASITYTRHMPLSNPLIHRITTNPFFAFIEGFTWLCRELLFLACLFTGAKLDLSIKKERVPLNSTRHCQIIFIPFPVQLWSLALLGCCCFVCEPHAALSLCKDAFSFLRTHTSSHL